MAKKPEKLEKRDSGISKADQETIETAMDRLEKCVKAEQHNREAAIEDLKFAQGIDQWDPAETKRRSSKGRPALTINLLPKFIDQVVGDMLHNSPSIKIHPASSRGDINIAKIRQGLIYHIEYASNAKAIYGYAARQMVTCGYGAWRVLTRYVKDNPFVQEVFLESIRNPFLAYMDPSSKDQSYADAKYGFILERVPEKEFKHRYPDAKLPREVPKTGSGLSNELWYTDNTVTIVEYFTIEDEEKTLVQMEDGHVVEKPEFDKMVEDWNKKNLILNDLVKKRLGNPQAGMQAGNPQVGMQPGNPQAPTADPMMGLAEQVGELGPEPKAVKTRKFKVPRVYHQILSACEIIEEKKPVPGKFIPIIILKGKELNIEGKNHVWGLVRLGKDSQKMINYWNTAAAETIALAPKAPWQATAKMIEGYENDYITANVDNLPVLKYNIDPELPGMKPERTPPSNPPIGIFEQIRRGEENLKSVLGMFNADVGGPTSQQTGEAVRAIQRPGDTSTFEFIENLSRAVLYTGRVINSMIPEVYDTERDVRVKHIDESESFVPINTTVASALQAVKSNPSSYPGLDPKMLQRLLKKDGPDAQFNDISMGEYDVVVSVGPSYATQRQESAQHLLQLVQAMPQQMAIASDLIVENMNFKDADELAARLRKPLVAQGITRPRPGEQPPQPPPPNPAMITAQVEAQQAQAKLQLEQVKLQHEGVKLEIEKIRMQIEMIKLQAEQAKPLDGGPDPMEQQEKIARLMLDAERLDLDKSRFQHQMGLDERNHEHQIETDNTDAIQEMMWLDHDRRAADQKYEVEMEKAKQKSKEQKKPKGK